jgi:hypothetical protein
MSDEVQPTRVTKPAPWWATYIPTARTWVAIGMFGLCGYALKLLSDTPTLGENKLFFGIVTAIFTSGLIGGVVAFYLGSSKSSEQKDATIATMASKAGDGQ